jgi:hypothetical protein
MNTQHRSDDWFSSAHTLSQATGICNREVVFPRWVKPIIPCTNVPGGLNNAGVTPFRLRAGGRGRPVKKRAVNEFTALVQTGPGMGLQMAFSLKHLSHSHIMPRTLPLVVIIFAACIGFPQHWGTLRLTIAFLVAAFAVLLISAMIVSPPCHFAKTCAL